MEKEITEENEGYARRAIILIANGYQPDKIETILNLANLDNQSRWEMVKCKREHMEKVMSSSDLFDRENLLKKSKGIDTKKILNAVRPGPWSDFADGNPLPLLLMLSGIVAPLLQAAAAKRAAIKDINAGEGKEKKFTLPEKAKGINPNAAVDIFKKAAAAVKPATPGLDASIFNRPGK